MRVKVFVLWVCLQALCSGAARAAERDPVWDRAVATIVLASRSVASRIETRTEVYNGSGKRMETREEVQTLTGWNDQEPIRKSDVKSHVVQKSGLEVGIELGARDNPFFASSEGRVFRERTGEDTLDGHGCITFRFEEKPLPGKEDETGTLVGTVWIDQETGTPLKMVYRPQEMPRHVSVYDLTVSFSVLPDGSTVPCALDMQMKAGFLWYKRVVRLHKSFSGWTTPPDAGAKDPSPGTEAADTR